LGETIDDAVSAASEALGDWINTVEANGGEVPWLDLLRNFGTIRM
jgi:predicted RNase H-like HicB family nuclease